MRKKETKKDKNVKLVMPDVVGEAIEDAEKILKEKNIEITEVKKKFDLFTKKDYVIKTEPEVGEKVKDKVVVTISRMKLLPLLLLCILFVFGGLIFGTGTISRVFTTSAPVIESKTYEWAKSGIVVVTKDAKMIDEVKNYEYCVTKRKTTIICKWKKTETKNVEITKSGVWNVYFRGIDLRGRRSKVSNRDYVKVDNDAPIIEKLKKSVGTKAIKISVKARDEHSGVNTYYYKINDGEYVLGEKEHTFKGLETNKEYKITIKVVDKVGNETEVEIKVTTKEEKNNEETPEEPNTPITPEEPTKPAEPIKPEEIIEPPYIDLKDVPSILEYREGHKLPSNYDFKNSTGTVTCKVGNDEYTNTKDLPIGNHTIVCTATNKEGMSTTVSKDVRVTSPVTDEESDGWIWLNLHYPAASTKREWKKLDENEVLSGNDLDWKDYTGPIRVKIEDIDKIYIRYMLDGNEVIVSPDGYYVDIEPEKTSVRSGNLTKVKINYSNNVEKVEYRINNGVWQEYTDIFEVGPNTSVEARIKYLIDVYDDEGNLLLQKTRTKSVAGYIGEIIDPTSNPSTPGKPNQTTTTTKASGGDKTTTNPVDSDEPEPAPSTCTTCSCVNGNYEIKIIPTSKYVYNNMPVKIKIEYEDGVTLKQYKTGENGEWQNYTGEITVAKGTKIFAKGSGYKEINGCTKWISGTASMIVGEKIYKVNVYPARTSIDSTETTTVEIGTWIKDNRISLEYSINGGDYQEYTKKLTVGPNTTIIARAKWVLEDGTEIVAQASATVNENKNGLRTSISSSANKVGGINQATIEIATNYKADKVEYTLDNGKTWIDYTGVFAVDPNTNVCGRSSKTNTDGTTQTSPMVCKYISEDDVELRIIPTAYIAKKGGFVTALIKANYNVEKIEYSLDGGSIWNTYTGTRVKIDAGSEILAKAIYKGNEITTSLKIDILNEIETLAGPTISSNPDTTLSKSVDIAITTKETARDVYYRINGGSWQNYTGAFKVTSNVKIESYYIRDSDGKRSQTSRYYVQNIHAGNLPYVRIDTDPKNYLINGTQDKVDVTISGQNYNTLEYSFDGINYQPYTGVIEVTTSSTIYAKGTNDVGSTVTSFTIVTKNPPKVWKTLSVEIVANPDSKDLVDSDGNIKLVNETEVSLVYGNDVTSVCYKFGPSITSNMSQSTINQANQTLASTPCTPYTGAFKIKQNETIYAYVQSADGKGSAVKKIDFLTLGIASPIISADTTTVTSTKNITIDYAKTADVKKYRIDNGAWIDYIGPFEVTSNCTIEAINEDVLGNQATSTYTVSNIVQVPNYNILNKGDYYLIRLNYPSNAIQNTREYKWKSDGVWKTYDDHGILLIKPSAASKLVTPNGVKIKDDQGNDVIFTDHYYILDVNIDKVGENLFMKWDTGRIEAPKIIVSEEEETVVSMDAAISYNKALVSKLYRVLYDDGTDTGWIDYNGKFKVEKKGYIYAKGVDVDGRDSEVATLRVDNIDSTGPVITVQGDMLTPKQKVTLMVSAKDDGKVDALVYAEGSQKASYFKKNGKGLANPSTITITENGTYTFYAVDGLGNETVQEIQITNIDKTAPDIEIKVLSTTVGTSTEVEINYDDSITMQYKVGETGTYQNYAGKFTLSSYDLFDLRNQDGSLTIYAKGKDQAGNESTVKEITYVLDLNPFATPVINVSDGYPMLTSTGMIQGKPSYTKYDTNTTDVTNYYSIDGGTTWKEYTGGITLVSGEIQAKSVRKSTGLEFKSSAKVVIPTNAIGTDTYDKNLQTSENLAKSGNKVFTVSPNIYGKEIKIYTGNNVSSTSTIKLYDKNKTLLNTIETKDVLTIVEVLNDTYYVEINSGSSTLEVREIELRGEREIFEEYTPIISINEGGWASEKIATIKYYNDEYTNEYSLDNGITWNTYTGPIKLIEPTNVIARATREGRVLGSSNFIVLKVDPTEPVIELNIANKIQLGYDQEIPTYYKQTLSGTTVECKDGDTVVTNIKELKVGSHKLICTAKTGAGKKATVEKNVKIIDMTDFVADSLLEAISNEDIATGRYTIKVNDEVYPVHVITLDGNQHFTENQTFGDAYDVGTASTYAQNMVIVKVNGDLEIDSGVTVAPYYNEYGGPKGFTIYVTGKLTNKGTIDNSHGAKAEGQNVYLWKNTDGSYEYVPAVGGAKGSGTYSGNGISGVNGTGRQTGGGGASRNYNGSAGTSYSGGSGAGSLSSAENNGGSGGKGSGYYNGSGAGNPNGGGTSSSATGGNGTGGLLTIYANEYENKGTISARGYKGGEVQPSSTYYIAQGASSGGGSINIFTNQSMSINQLGIITDTRYEEIKGKTVNAGGITTGVTSKGGAGGNGTVNIGEIRKGQYYDLKDIIEQDKETYKESVTVKGDSILSILNDNNLKTGYYYFVANGENYPVHLITLDGNQHFTENQTFGDAYDVGTASTYAQNMVIVKVNGDLEIDSGVTVAPYYNEYGGPKGFTIYVTGKLTNKGTIDNSHGAKAEGQNVYLWKNTDGSYEYVPATGATGGKSSSNKYANSGTNGVGRQTGGGGAGSGSQSGTGGTGTSYSGGTGASSLTGNGSNDGSEGGNLNSSNKTNTNFGSGAGNPAGQTGIYGQNGTGGLLTIYANEYENKGTLNANGYLGGKGNLYAGGSSGGGTINIFTNQNIDLKNPKSITDLYDLTLGNVSVQGGPRIETTPNGYYYSGSGGLGTINIGKIVSGRYIDYRKYLETEVLDITSGEEISGSSILEIINSNELGNGYYTFVINEEKYKVHVYSYENSQHWSESVTFGNGFDIGDKDFYAQSMVVVKVNGDLEIDKGVTISPYYTEYGGPKGFTLYVTGTLTNNGIIDNSHGAYAEGQDVYLWKNTDGTYEYVPKVGAEGGKQRKDFANSPGYSGQNGKNRQTGGGGSGGYYNNGASGAGSAGTSYSGGSGGAGKYYFNPIGASSNGGQGGIVNIANSDSSYSSYSAGGGAGNPGGTGNPISSNKGQNGTGGLLIISSSKLINNGKISSNGSLGGTGYAGGGSSGGGSINIFTLFDITEKGQINVSGGASSTTGVARGGIGGNGTITYTQLQPVTITSNYSYPIISTTKNESEQYEITINYFSTLNKKLYSIDNGSTWLEYKGSFNVDAGTIVQAKGVNTDKTETEVISYTTPSSNGIPYNTIDGNIESNAVLEINKDYTFTVSEDTIGKNLRFYLGSEPSNDATIKIYDKDNKELLSTIFVNNLTVINIPTNAYKFIINAGSKELTINEINIRKELEKNETIPSISINDVNWTSSKTIEIIYPEGYKNEYSLDLGTTWNEYTEPITVEKNTTILTRVVKDEKVIGSSSFVVTSIDNVEPEISLDIDETIDKGTDIKIPTSYNLGLSGGTTICKTGETTITNISELEVGTHEITCTVTNGANINKSVTKNVIIKEKEEQVIEPTTEETTNP